MRRLVQVRRVVFLVAIVLLGLGTAGVGQAAPGAQGATPTACVTTSEDENEAIARQWHEVALNEGQLDVIDTIVAPDVNHRSVTFTDLTGPAGVKQNLQSALTSFPDLQYTIEDVITEDDKVVVRWRAEGTQEGTFQGVPPTGKHLTWTGVNIYRLACGQIAEVWTEVDGVGRLRQLGVLPGPGTPVAIPTP